MTPAQPFALRVFVPSGIPEGLRIVEKSNWSGIGFVVPRSQLAEFLVRPEAQRPGVYVLLGPEADGSDELAYIGETDDTIWLSQAQMAEPPCPIHRLHTRHASRSTARPMAWESFPSRLSSR
jgi:hypothetical protein